MLDFEIHTSVFLELFGIYLAFFGVMWTISHTIKAVRS